MSVESRVVMFVGNKEVFEDAWLNVGKCPGLFVSAGSL